MSIRLREKYRSGEKALTSEQVQALFAIKDIPLIEEGLLRLAINGGMRREDVVSIRQSDVHEEGNKIIFYEKKKRRTWQVYVKDETIKTLHQIKEQYPSIWMFPVVNQKKHLSSKTAYNILQRNLKKIGINHNVPFHALRATCYKLCQKAGYTAEMASKHIGDSVKVASEHYATPSDEEMRQAMRDRPIY